MKKNTLIFGDSYSTFEGYIPQGYAAYYSTNERPETDVRQVSQTWWHQVCRAADLNLVLNSSWSGSTVGYRGYDGEDCSGGPSFIYRLRQLIADGFFEKNTVDTVFVFGGTNDSWCEAPLGEEKYGDWQEADLYCALPALCYFLDLLRRTLPEARIYCLINTDLKPEITACLQAAAGRLDMRPVTFEAIQKRCNHPTIQGMEDIRRRVLQVLAE